MSEKVEILIEGEDGLTRPAQSGARALGNLNKAAKQASMSLGGIAKMALGFAGGMLAFQGGVKVFGALKEGIVDFNASMEQSRIAWTTMLGSAEAAEVVLHELQQFAAKTPFEFPELEQSSKRLLAMGFAAKDIIPMMTDLGNAASALGLGTEGVNRLTLALGQMRAKSKVSGEEMRQLAEAGIPAWEILAKAVGKPIPEVMKLSEQGKIAAGVFIKAFQDFSKQNWGGMMEKQSRTFLGAISTIKDNLRLLTSDAFKPLFDRMSELALKFADFLQTERFRDFALQFQSLMETILDNGERAIDGLIAAWGQLDKYARMAIIGIAGLMLAGGPLLSGIKAVILGIQKIAQAILFLASFAVIKVAMIGAAFVGLITVVQGIGDQIIHILMNTVAEVVRGIGMKMVEIGWIFGDWGKGIVNAGNALKAFEAGTRTVDKDILSIDYLIGSIGKRAAWVGEQVSNGLGLIGDVVTPEFKMLADSVDSLAKGAITNFFDTEQYRLKQSERMWRAYLEVPKAIGDLTKKSSEEMAASLDTLKAKAKEAGISISELKNALIALHPAALAAAVAVAYWNSQIEAVNLAIIANRDQIRAAQAEYDRLGESLRAAQAEYGRMADNLGVLNQKLSDAKARLADLAAPRLTGMGELDKQMSAIERQMKRLQLAELDLPSLEELRNQMTKKVRIYAADGSKYIEMTQEGTGAEEKLAEMRKAAMDKVLKQFPEMTEEMKNYLATLPLTKEGLQKALEQLQLTKDLKFDEALQKIKEAAEGVKEEMTFEEAMKQIADTKAEIAGLTSEIAAQEMAMKAQQAIIDSINASMENQRKVIAEIQAAGDKLNDTLAQYQKELAASEARQKLINDALELAYGWFLDDRQAMMAMGGEAVTQAGIIDVKTQALLEAVSGAASESTEISTETLAAMVAAYKRDMATSIGTVGDLILKINDIPETKTTIHTTVHRDVYEGGGGSTAETEQRASGGPVYPGRAYLVGEAGPEIFRPNAGGSIIPNSRSAGGNTYVYVTVQGTVTAERDLAETVRRELIRVKSRNVTSGL